MRVVTTQYWWKRRHSVTALLPWSLRNEVRQNGYLTLPRPWEASPRRWFSIDRWLNPDGGTIDAYGRYDEPMPRYSEVFDFPMNNWNAVRHPWNDKPVKPITCFHTQKERAAYLNATFDKALDHLTNGGKVTVMHLPYGGLPIVSVTSEDGKVTIF